MRSRSSDVLYVLYNCVLALRMYCTTAAETRQTKTGNAHARFQNGPHRGVRRHVHRNIKYGHVPGHCGNNNINAPIELCVAIVSHTPPIRHQPKMFHEIWYHYHSITAGLFATSRRHLERHVTTGKLAAKYFWREGTIHTSGPNASP